MFHSCISFTFMAGICLFLCATTTTMEGPLKCDWLPKTKVCFPFRSASKLSRHTSAEGLGLSKCPSELESPDSEAQLTVCGCIPCSPETKDTLTEMLDMSLFKDIIFILFTVSNFLTSIGFYMPYAYLGVRLRLLPPPHHHHHTHTHSVYQYPEFMFTGICQGHCQTLLLGSKSACVNHWHCKHSRPFGSWLHL